MHVNQKPRRRHSEQFKAQVLAAAPSPAQRVVEKRPRNYEGLRADHCDDSVRVFTHLSIDS